MRSSTWRQSYYNLSVQGSSLVTKLPLTKHEINQIVSMVRAANIRIEEPSLNEQLIWVFDFDSPEEAARALLAATEQEINPKLDLLGLGVCMESSSPEPTSGSASASGTNRASFSWRLH